MAPNVKLRLDLRIYQQLHAILEVCGWSENRWALETIASTLEGTKPSEVLISDCLWQCVVAAENSRHAVLGCSNAAEEALLQVPDLTHRAFLKRVESSSAQCHEEVLLLLQILAGVGFHQDPELLKRMRPLLRYAAERKQRRIWASKRDAACGEAVLQYLTALRVLP